MPKGGDTIAKVFLPAVTAVGQNLFGLMMSASIFSHSAETFRPEKFLKCDDERKTEMKRTAELAFGSGRQLCAGKLVVWTQLIKMVFKLLRTCGERRHHFGRTRQKDS